MIQDDDSIYNQMIEKSAGLTNAGPNVISRMRVLMDHFGDDILKVSTT